jgi:hypothetical protein
MPWIMPKCRPIAMAAAQAIKAGRRGFLPANAAEEALSP